MLMLNYILFFIVLIHSKVFSNASQTSSSCRNDNFCSCYELNKYYVNHALSILGPDGFNSNNVYIQARTDAILKIPGTPGGRSNLIVKEPEAAFENPGKPPRPEDVGGMKFNQFSSDPKFVEFSNISMRSAEERETKLSRVNQKDSFGFSKINVQVEGVDEPDILMVDGNRVFIATGSRLSIFNILDNGKRGRRTGFLLLPTNQPLEMLIEGDYVLLVGEYFNYQRSIYKRFNQTSNSDPIESTILFQIYVGGAKPKLIQSLVLEGRYIKALSVDGIARVVTNFDPLKIIAFFGTYQGYTQEQVDKWNLDIIQKSKPGNWLPTYRLTKGRQVQTGVYANCTNVYHRKLNVSSGFRLLLVVTIPIKSSLLLPKSSSAIVSDADTVYSNKKSMYISTSEFHFKDREATIPRWDANYRTWVHKFVFYGSTVKYVATGQLSGSVLNQYSMHVHKNKMFITTTDGASWWPGSKFTSKVTSFVINWKKGQLIRLGNLGNLGVSERLYSVRYVKEKAYIVTFFDVDPLYVIDLGNPRAIKLNGKVKTPGFSTYLHPISSELLLGVGRDPSKEGQSQFQTTKLSLFNINDKKNPKEVASWILKNSGTIGIDSIVQEGLDQRGFLYWTREDIVVLPLLTYTPNFNPTSIIFKVRNSSITELGRIFHRAPSPMGDGFVQSQITRNVIVKSSNLWSLSHDFIQVNHLTSLNQTFQKRR